MDLLASSLTAIAVPDNHRRGLAPSVTEGTLSTSHWFIHQMCPYWNQPEVLGRRYSSFTPDAQQIEQAASSILTFSFLVFSLGRSVVT